MKQKTCFGLSTDRGYRLIVSAFEGLGFITACEPNPNAPCDWKLGVQLKEKGKVYAASQLEDDSIKESSSDNFIEPFSDFLQINDLIEQFNAKYDDILLLTVSTKDGKNKTYPVKDVKVLNNKEMEIILGPGPNPNDVPFSNMAEEMGFLVLYSGDQRIHPINFLASVNWKLNIPFLSLYNASENKLEVQWSDTPVDTIPFAAGGAGDFALFAAAGIIRWVQVQIANGMPIKLFGIDSKGKEVSMVRKVSGYSFAAGKLRLDLWSKGLKAKSGDKAAIGALRESSSGKYRNVRITSFIDLALGLGAGASFGGTSRYSYSFPVLQGVMRRGKDGKVRVAFKAGKEKAFKYDKQTEVISSMDVGNVITKAFGSEWNGFGWLLMRLKRKLESESGVYPIALEKCGLSGSSVRVPIRVIITGLKKGSNDIMLGNIGETVQLPAGIDRVEVEILGIGREWEWI